MLIRKHHTPEGFVIFDDVFVPYERVFLDGQVEHAACLPIPLGYGNGSWGLPAWLRAMTASRFRPAHCRGQWLQRGAHQGENIRDDHQRHPSARLP